MIYYKCFDISKYKALELQLSRWEGSKLFDIEFWVRKKGKQDHHGFDFSLTLFHYEFRIAFYDSRHVEDITGIKPTMKTGTVDIPEEI